MSHEFQKVDAVITDTSCFILLEKINALQILRILYKNIITTPEIANEFGKSLPDWVEIRSVINKNLQNSYAENVDIGKQAPLH